MFTNLILVSLISFSPIQTTHEINYESHQKLYLYIQSCMLIKYDIYDCTKNGLGKSFYSPIYNCMNYNAKEANVVADYFQKNNQWDLSYLAAITVNALVYYMIPDITDSKNNSILSLQNLYMIALSLAETYAIASWDGSREINIHTTIFIKTF